MTSVTFIHFQCPKHCKWLPKNVIWTHVPSRLVIQTNRHPCHSSSHERTHMTHITESWNQDVLTGLCLKDFQGLAGCVPFYSWILHPLLSFNRLLTFDDACAKNTQDSVFLPTSASHGCATRKTSCCANCHVPNDGGEHGFRWVTGCESWSEANESGPFRAPFSFLLRFIYVYLSACQEMQASELRGHEYFLVDGVFRG